MSEHEYEWFSSKDGMPAIGIDSDGNITAYIRRPDGTFELVEVGEDE